MRHAFGAGVEESIAAQLRAAEHAKRLRDAARAEAADMRDAQRGRVRSCAAAEQRLRVRASAHASFAHPLTRC
jgi:hypothetical protein